MFQAERGEKGLHAQIGRCNMDFVFSQTVPPVETGMSKHTNASSREPTGGLTRREGATRSERSGSAERGNGPQSQDWRNLLRETCQSLAAMRTQEERGNAMHGGGRHKRSMHRWHGFAAILSVMTV
jgi:hypothetical protein